MRGKKYFILLILVLISLIILISFYKGQPMNLRTFNVQMFQEHISNSSYKEYNFTNKDGYNVKQIQFDDQYKEEIAKENSPYQYSYVYNKDGKLMYQYIEFYRARIGKDIAYNDQQKIIKEIDHGPHFKVSIEQLADIMKHCCHVDIFNKKQVNRVVIGYDSYEIYAYNQEDTSFFHSYLVDANTGKILFKTDEIRNLVHPCPPCKTLFGEYFKSDEFKARQKNK